MADIGEYLDKAYEQQEFPELAELPIDALQGVSKADAEAIRRAFGVKTIRQLAEHQFIRAAQLLSYQPSSDGNAGGARDRGTVRRLSIRLSTN